MRVTLPADAYYALLLGGTARIPLAELLDEETDSPEVLNPHLDIRLDLQGVDPEVTLLAMLSSLHNGDTGQAARNRVVLDGQPHPAAPASRSLPAPHTKYPGRSDYTGSGV